MRARARALMDTSDPALRRMQAQARLGAPLNDAERLGALYGGAMASIELRDFATADAMLAGAQQLMAEHAALVAQQAREHAAAPAADPAASAAAPAASGAYQAVTVHGPLYPLEPEVARDFALLRLEEAIARRAPAEIAAAAEALGDGRERALVIARAQAAVGRYAAHDPTVGRVLQAQTEALQTWVTVHPKDATAWTLLAQCAEPIGDKLRAIRAEAEAHAANGDLTGAIDRLHAGQKLTRTGKLDFVEASIIDTRLHELEAQRRELQKEAEH
jgi:predicted Zn-dependent protease